MRERKVYGSLIGRFILAIMKPFQAKIKPISLKIRKRGTCYKADSLKETTTLGVGIGIYEAHCRFS